MEKCIKGNAVVRPFPFPDLTGSKKNTVLVLAEVNDNNILLCQITSQQARDNNTISLFHSDPQNCYLPADSNICPLRVFAGDKAMVARKAVPIKMKIKSPGINQIGVVSQKYFSKT